MGGTGGSNCAGETEEEGWAELRGLPLVQNCKSLGAFQRAVERDDIAAAGLRRGFASQIIGEVALAFAKVLQRAPDQWFALEPELIRREIPIQNLDDLGFRQIVKPIKYPDRLAEDKRSQNSGSPASRHSSTTRWAATS